MELENLIDSFKLIILKEVVVLKKAVNKLTENINLTQDEVNYISFVMNQYFQNSRNVDDRIALNVFVSRCASSTYVIMTIEEVEYIKNLLLNIIRKKEAKIEKLHLVSALL